MLNLSAECSSFPLWLVKSINTGLISNLNCLGKASLTTIYLPRFSYDLYCSFSGIVFPDFFLRSVYRVVLWKITLLGFLSISIAATAVDSLFEKAELRMSAGEKVQIRRRKYMINRSLFLGRISEVSGWYGVWYDKCHNNIYENVLFYVFMWSKSKGLCNFFVLFFFFFFFFFFLEFYSVKHMILLYIFVFYIFSV